MLDEMILPLFNHPWGRRLCWGVFAIVCLLFTVTLIKIPLTWYTDSKLSKAPAVAAIDLPVLQVQSSDLIQQVPGWHLFGNAEKTADTSFLPITSLQLRLIGIVQAYPESKSSVIISEAGQPGKVYLVCDMLPVGVKVDAIT